MTLNKKRPLVIVPACLKPLDDRPYHIVQGKYLDAVLLGAECVPVILPALGDAADLADWAALLDCADGIMLTGSPSNVHPSHYGQDVADPSLPQDPARDATTLPLIHAAIARGLPLLAICRGFQEVNVALGGSLHQAVHDVDGLHDHREQTGGTLDEQYAPAHPVALVAGGQLSTLLGGAASTMVNSLHGQGVDRLAQGLVAEANAADGLVEAFRISASPTFALGVQWHPEWQVLERPDSLALFRAFGQACRDFQAARAQQQEHKK